MEIKLTKDDPGASEAGDDTTDEVAESNPAQGIDVEDVSEPTDPKGAHGIPTSLGGKASEQLVNLGFDKQMVGELIAQIEVGCQKLGRGRNYTARQVLGHAIWSTLSREQQIATGRSFPILCKAGAVRLIDTGKKNYSNARFYRLK